MYSFNFNYTITIFILDYNKKKDNNLRKEMSMFIYKFFEEKEI